MQITSCQRCELYSQCNGVIKPRGKYTQPIVIVQDTPTLQDDDVGVIGIGDAGIMLERAFASISCNTQSFYVTSLVRCKPKDKLKKSQIYACYRYLYRELVSRQPKCIVLLGDAPLKLFLDSKANLTECNGKYFNAPLPRPRTIAKRKDKKLYTDQVYCFLPLFHPSALLRNYSLDVGSHKWHTWKALLKLASDFDFLF